MKRNKSNPEDFVVLATFHRRPQASTLKSELEAAGIEVKLGDERKLQRFWFIAPAKAGVHVEVRRKCYEKAEKILKKHDRGARKAVHCPSCGSSRVQYPALTRKNILPAIGGSLLAALHVIEHKYYCEDCHYTWPQHKADTRPTQILE